MGGSDWALYIRAARTGGVRAAARRNSEVMVVWVEG